MSGLSTKRNSRSAAYPGRVIAKRTPSFGAAETLRAFEARVVTKRPLRRNSSTLCTDRREETEAGMTMIGVPRARPPEEEEWLCELPAALDPPLLRCCLLRRSEPPLCPLFRLFPPPVLSLPPAMAL